MCPLGTLVLGRNNDIAGVNEYIYFVCLLSKNINRRYSFTTAAHNQCLEPIFQFSPNINEIFNFTVKISI